jgi:alpha-beta hydrolase superfamily lysophospholipase
MQVDKRKIFRWLKVIIILYCGIGLLIYFFQEKLLFHPKSLEKDYVYTFSTPFKELNIVYDSSTIFNTIQFFPTDTLHTKGVVLYFHGNKENINRYAPYVTNFTKHGFEVWITDYPTFGKSTGTLSEKLLQVQAMELYKMANSKYNDTSIILYGKSLGTGLASFVASKKNCKQLILETPYSSISSLFKRYGFIYPIEKMIRYKLPVIDYVKKVTAPILIFQGSNDWVIPNSNTELLKQHLKQTDEFVTIDGANHNSINNYILYQKKMDSLLQ